MNIVAKPYATAFIELARNKPEVLCVSADLTSSCEVDTFRDQFPERFFSMGLTEQNMLSLCGGLALEGFRPFIHTFSVFMYRRAYDQIVNSIAYSNRSRSHAPRGNALFDALRRRTGRRASGKTFLRRA